MLVYTASATSVRETVSSCPVSKPEPALGAICQVPTPCLRGTTDFPHVHRIRMMSLYGFMVSFFSSCSRGYLSKIYGEPTVLGAVLNPSDKELPQKTSFGFSLMTDLSSRSLSFHFYSIKSLGNIKVSILVSYLAIT